MSGAQEIGRPQVINATLLRTRTRDILEQAKFRGEHFIVETFGKPMVAIVGIDEYRALMDQARRAEDGRVDQDMS
jgi:antitoxin (DNA-binding transcriptional repressor) of toxin-antitoxin stability system